MIRHVVLFKFPSTVSREEKEKIILELEKLQELIPGIREWEIGVQLRTSNKEYDVAEIGTFEDEEALDRFRAHPAHNKIRDHMIRIGAKWTAVDYREPRR